MYRYVLMLCGTVLLGCFNQAKDTPSLSEEGKKQTHTIEELSMSNKPLGYWVPAKVLDTVEFWRIINASAQNSSRDVQQQSKYIERCLSLYTPEQIIEFEVILCKYILEANSFKVLAAAKITNGWVTDDGYLYFRCWLIGQGESVFRGTLDNPDYLADKVQMLHAQNEFEELLYVSTHAFQQKTGRQVEDDSFPRSIAYRQGLDYGFSAPPPEGEDWKTEDLPQLYPKLWSVFHKQ